jgi:hypothetical protein
VQVWIWWDLKLQTWDQEVGDQSEQVTGRYCTMLLPLEWCLLMLGFCGKIS